MKILPVIEQSYAYKLPIIAKCSYSYSCKMIKEFERFGWIIVEKKGPRCYYKYTDEGKKVREMCIDMSNSIGGDLNVTSTNIDFLKNINKV